MISLLLEKPCFNVMNRPFVFLFTHKQAHKTRDTLKD